MIKQTVWAAMMLVLLARPAAAEGPVDLKPFDADRQACSEQVSAIGNNWVGWHHDVGGGYGENFEFYDGSLDGMASELMVTRYIDAIAREDTAWCYRGDGSLALIEVTMLSPNMAEGGEMGPLIRREGRLYFDPAGKTVAIRAWIADADGNKLGAINNAAYQLARDCNLVDLRPKVDDANAQYLSVLGDIEGNHPAYSANELDWCAVAKEGP